MGVEQEKQPFMKMAAGPMDPVETGSRALHILKEKTGRMLLASFHKDNLPCYNLNRQYFETFNNTFFFG